MKLTLTPTRITYSVEVDHADFVRLLDSEGFGSDRRIHDYLSVKLDSLPGVADTDYQRGHYGAQIILTLDAEDDTPANHKMILDTIEAHLETLRAVEGLRK